MKKYLLLQYETFDFLPESEVNIEGHKEELHIFISFIETEDKQLLKELQKQAEELIYDIEELKKVIETPINFDDIEYILKDNKKIRNDIDNILHKLKIKNEKYLKNADNFKSKDKEYVLEYHKLAKKHRENEEQYLSIKKERIKNFKIRQEEAIEEKDIKDKALRKNYDNQQILNEKIRKVKTKTEEDIYNEITSTRMYEIIEDRLITDDGKFLAFKENYIKIKNRAEWEKNNKASKEFGTIEELMAYLKIDPIKNIKTADLEMRKKERQFEKLIKTHPAVIEAREFKNFENHFIEQEKQYLKIVNDMEKTESKLKTFEKNLNSLSNGIDKAENEIKSFGSMLMDELLFIKNDGIKKVKDIVEKSKNKTKAFFNKLFKKGK